MVERTGRRTGPVSTQWPLSAGNPGGMTMPPIFWSQRQDIGPSPRVGHGMTYDAARQRVVVFGGDPGGQPLSDTWAWDGSLWTQVADTGPSARHSLALGYDAQGGRVVLFGGASGGTAFDDTWTFDGDEWTQVADTGPEARSGHAVAWDTTRQRLVLFGGHAAGPVGDTWEWNGTEWTQIQDVGPSPRRGHSMAFDAGRGRVILFGGAGADGTGLDDTWAWDGSAWTQVADTGPEPRAAATVAGSGSILLFGGVSSMDASLAPSARTIYGDSWQLTGQGWTKVQDIGPAPRWGHGAAIRAVAGSPSRVVVFGGATALAGPEDPALVPVLRRDTWEVPEPPGGAGQPQPQPQPQALQIMTVVVQPPTVTQFGTTVMTATVITSMAPPAGTSPSIRMVRGQAPNWSTVTTGFVVPSITFTGAGNTTALNIIKDGTLLPAGQYGVEVTIGTSSRIGTFVVL